MVLLRTAAFVNALGVVGGGLGFVAGGISTGTMEGALAGAEKGFKYGTCIQLAIDIVVAAVEVTPGIAKAFPILGETGSLGVFSFDSFFYSSIQGEIAKAIARNAGGVLNPDQEGFGYNKKSASRGEAVGDFAHSAGGIYGDTRDYYKANSLLNSYYNTGYAVVRDIGVRTFFTGKSWLEGKVWENFKNWSVEKPMRSPISGWQFRD
jgi:hypothetical protein